MNDYRTTILFDLRRAVIFIRREDVEGTELLYGNIGFWLNQVPDIVEQNKWMELFVIEMAKTVPGLHEDYLYAALQKFMDDAKAVQS